jgi:hypothetical protein
VRSLSKGKNWHVGSGSSAARLLGLRVRIPSGAWISVSCECCVLSGLRRAGHWSRGVLPSVVCLSELEEPHCGGLDTLVLLSHEKKFDTLHILVPYRETNVQILRTSLVIKIKLEGLFDAHVTVHR